MGFIPPSITEDIIEMIEHYGMTVNATLWSPEAGEFQMEVESPRPMKWDSVISMIEYEFGISVLKSRYGYSDEYSVTINVYP